MNYSADSVEYWSKDGIETVFFGNEAKELALTISSVPGTADHYFEWNDQSNACHNAVKSIGLTGSKLEIQLLAKPAKQLGVAKLGISLQCDAGVLAEVATRLEAILGSRFKLSKQKTTAKAAPKQKDYSKIQYLNLEGKNLKALPEYVREMTALETACLGYNPNLDFGEVCEVLAAMPALKELTITTRGPVPESIGRLRALEKLHLDGFTEPQVFPESFGELSQLRELQIMSDADVVLPESCAGLTNLASLNVRAPGWQAPVEIHKLTKLTSLDLEHCRFARLPEGMAGMDAVTTVFLGGQSAEEFAQLLPVVARMRNVKTLQLAVHVIPEEIALCQRIEELTVWGARQIPAAIGKLKGLQTLVLSIGDFEALPEAVGELTGLTFLNVSENPSLRALPESLGNLTRLENLFVHENPRLTRLPASLGKLKSLEQVRPENWRELLIK